MGEAEARRFYTAPLKKRGGGLGWSKERFNQVAWESLYATLEPKPDMYGVWLSKQSSGSCATRYNLAKRSKTLQGRLDDKCPNCGLVEKAEHLNVCPSKSRAKLLEEGVKLLEQWMGQDARTNLKLA